MKKFQFRLEALVKYKEFLEQKAKLEVAKAHGDVLACEENISRLKDEYDQTLQKLDDEVNSGIKSEKYLQYNHFLSNIESLIENENERLKQLLKIFVEKQQFLAKKSIEKKTIENLKSLKKEEYYNEIRANEQKIIDDNVILRNARKNDL